MKFVKFLLGFCGVLMYLYPLYFIIFQNNWQFDWKFLIVWLSFWFVSMIAVMIAGGDKYN